MNAWYRGVVIRGRQEGRTIGFPTLNLSPKNIKGRIKNGVHACLVRHGKKVYKSVLYYGPRLVKDESHNVLEIHMFDSQGNLYGKLIEFAPIAYIRGVRHFQNMQEMRTAIGKDVVKAKRLLDENM